MIRTKPLALVALGVAAGCVGQIEQPAPTAEPERTSTSTTPAPPGINPPPPDGPTADACAEVVSRPTPVVVARLTRTEYIRTVRDVFGVDVTAQARDLPYEIRAPFTTTAVAQSTDIQHLEIFSEVAATVALSLGDFAGDFTECTDFTDACERALIAGLGERTFRRPVRTEEIDRFQPVFRVVQNEGDSFQTAASLVLRAMLQSPQFLYHLEDRRGEGVRDLAPHELARRIAYLVWQSAPDDVLVNAANDRELSIPQVEYHVRRLAADPRAQEASLAFFEDWVDLTRLERAVRGLEDSLRAQMREETERLVQSVLWADGGGLIDVLGANYTFLTPELAEQYGLTSTVAGWHRYDLLGVPARRGVLTQGSLLAAHANGNRPAFVSRGLFMLRAMLCRDVPNPPAGVDTNLTELPETASEREKSAERLGRNSCNGCHSTFDPLAYAFEGYTGFGQLTETDPNGNAVQQNGWVPARFGARPGTPEAQRYDYRDVDGLVEILVNAPFVQECMAEKPLGFALRRRISDVVEDRCAVQAIAEATEQRGGSYVDLLVSNATHPLFTQLATVGTDP